jgi:hypothetical protein
VALLKPAVKVGPGGLFVISGHWGPVPWVA